MNQKLLRLSLKCVVDAKVLEPERHQSFLLLFFKKEALPFALRL
jgi:hypothetical protein